MKPLFLTASIAALVLAACAPANETPAGDAASGEEAGAEETVSPESAPLPVDLGSPVFEETAEDYSVRAVVDSRIAAFQSALAEDLMTSAKSRLEAFKADAIRDGADARERSAATGEENWFRPYSMEIRFTQSAQAGDAIGIEQFTMVDTAGAHPNYILTGLVHERGDEYPISLEAVVTDMSGYGASLKKHLIEAKSERAYDDAARANVPAEVEEILGSDAEAASKFGQNFTLAPSTEAGKFGGITVLFSPYDAGPYAEGSYEITIPAAELSGKLTPAWEARFGGEPDLPAENPQ
ncbi:RsiV family protein [Hyphomonas sp. NPDC076900]|uniref:RsiV family protein n=1 Tax=unclassified Hyphomonas TaxID=2630699 RepID=UPI003CFE0AB1